jgi:hypothetical protein
LRDNRKSVVPDPKRHFANANYRTAKGSFDRLGSERELRYLGNAWHVRFGGGFN